MVTRWLLVDKEVFIMIPRDHSESLSNDDTMYHMGGHLYGRLTIADIDNYH